MTSFSFDDVTVSEIFFFSICLGVDYILQIQVAISCSWLVLSKQKKFRLFLDFDELDSCNPDGNQVGNFIKQLDALLAAGSINLLFERFFFFPHLQNKIL